MMGSREILRSARAVLMVVVFLALMGTAAEAVFLVLATRAALALGSGLGSIEITDSFSLGFTPLLLVAGAALLVKFISSLVSAAILSRHLAAAALRLRVDLAEAYLDAEWALKESLGPGRLLQLLSNYTQTAVTVVSAAARGFTAVASLTALLSIALVLDRDFTLMAGALVIILGAAMIPLRRRVRDCAESAVERQLEYASVIGETEALALEIEALRVGEETLERVRTSAAEAADTMARSHRIQLVISPVYQLSAYGAIVVLIGVGAGAGVGNLTAAGSVLVLLLRVLSYGQSLQVARAQFSNADVYASMLSEELVGFRGSKRTPRNAIDLDDRGTKVGAGLHVERLEFAYDGVPTLSDIEFVLAPGEILGIVGPSGSGKSTLTQLILGLRTSGGRLMFDGVDINDADPRWWSRTVALVPQNAELLAGSTSENVRFLRPWIKASAVEAACTAAAIDDDILALPDGYDTHLGERGNRLSGGQRQRISIARALAGEPKLLVLDEPTSALDDDSESRVLDGLTSLESEPSIILVTHRPAALEICDRVMRLDNGRITYLGPAAGYGPRQRVRCATN